VKKTLSILLVLALVVPLAAQKKPKPKTPPAQPAAQAAQAKPEAPPAKPGEAEPKPYDKVITPEFMTQSGLIKVHQLKTKVFFEIPTATLNQDLLLVVTIKKSPSEASFPGEPVQNMVVRWELRENKVLLRSISYSNIADPSQTIHAAVEAMNTGTILMAFPVEAFAADGSPVIDPVKFFTGDINEIPVKKILGGQSIDPSRTFFDKARVFPINLNVEATQTFNPKPPQLPAGFPPQFADMLPPTPSPTAVIFYSFVRLPEKPMMARLFDDRVGYFTTDQADYGRPEHETTIRHLVTRWRLEKKDPAAAKSEPAKPIVFYVDPATPAKWASYVKRGVEAWQPAFEAAGFVNAIQAKYAPTPQEDPDWSPDDARISTIRWVPSTIANAMGPSIVDPRSGEILEADVIIWHNVQQLARDWYWVQSGPLDPRAKTLPIPDEVMGDILLYIVTHEVGHSLGLPHNFKASALYPIAKIRDKDWVKANSHVPTLMDYARFNYVAQPEDGLDPKDLIPKIGPYDVFSIKWGYTPIPSAKTPDEEKPVLNEWCKPQETTPWLRFSTAGTRGTDPGEETEAVGDIDPVEATRLGIKNLKRVMDMLPGAVLKPGENYDDLDHMYTAVWSQLRLEFGHVANLVGGYDSEPKAGPAAGVRFTPIGEDRQKAAVKFLNDNLFTTPAWIEPAEILRKVEPTSGQARLLALQQGILASLLAQGRTARLQEHEAILGAKAYTIAELLSDLRAGIFSEFTAEAGRVDPYRRNLQRIFITVLGNRLNPAPASAGAAAAASANDDSRGAIRAQLKSIRALLLTRVEGAADTATRNHVQDLIDQIAVILDPRGVTR
jgi:Met-zincin/Domain of unknown function (DUF5117)/Domain of unknown function (DUF5118)